MSNFKAFLKAGHARTWAEKGGRARPQISAEVHAEMAHGR